MVWMTFSKQEFSKNLEELVPIFLESSSLKILVEFQLQNISFVSSVTTYFFRKKMTLRIFQTILSADEFWKCST